jgi:hypothetical protein
MPNGNEYSRPKDESKSNVPSIGMVNIKLFGVKYLSVIKPRLVFTLEGLASLFLSEIITIDIFVV